MAAKEVLIDAHLGAAHDIAWGEWKEKDKAVARWLERAAGRGRRLVNNEGGSQEQVFRVHIRALAAYVGVRGGIDPEPTVKAVVGHGRRADRRRPRPRAARPNSNGTWAWPCTTPCRSARCGPITTPP